MATHAVVDKQLRATLQGELIAHVDGRVIVVITTAGRERETRNA
jgi:hypothetical protein